VTNEEKILHPFPTLDEFVRSIKAVGDVYFGKYDFTVDWSEASLMDAYSFWTSEVHRCAREIHPNGISTSERQSSPKTPSQLKKVGALTSALNRTKSIRALNAKLDYEFHPKSSFQENVVEIYFNELLAFEVATSFLRVADQVRDVGKMVDFDCFLKAVSLTEAEIFSEAYTRDVCFFLRSRAPSATSMYMMYKSLFATAYAWRKKASSDGD